MKLLIKDQKTQNQSCDFMCIFLVQLLTLSVTSWHMNFQHLKKDRSKLNKVWSIKFISHACQGIASFRVLKLTYTFLASYSRQLCIVNGQQRLHSKNKLRIFFVSKTKEVHEFLQSQILVNIELLVSVIERDDGAKEPKSQRVEH